MTASKLKLPINWEMATGMSKEAAGRLKISVFQDVIFRLSFHSLRIYFRHVPIIAGKAWIWQRVATPQVRRGLSIEAKASFGAVFHGAFPDLIHSHLFFFGIWEPILSTYLAGVLRPGDTVIDIGANVGAHTLLAAHLVGPAGHVHAIEASPHIFAKLQENIRLNGMTNVRLYNVAVTDVAGSALVYLHSDYNLGATTIVPEELVTRETKPEVVVTALPLQEIVPLEVIKAAKVIKIDVEGAEWLVAKGMASILPELSEQVIIIVEVSPIGLQAFDVSPAVFLKLFTDAGFKAYQFAGEPIPDTPQFYRRAVIPYLPPTQHLDRDIVFRRS